MIWQYASFFYRGHYYQWHSLCKILVQHTETYWKHSTLPWHRSGSGGFITDAYFLDKHKPATWYPFSGSSDRHTVNRLDVRYNMQAGDKGFASSSVGLWRALRTPHEKKLRQIHQTHLSLNEFASSLFNLSKLRIRHKSLQRGLAVNGDSILEST